MQWIIQENMYREKGYQTLIDTLVRFEVPIIKVKVVPIIDKLIPDDFDTHAYYGDYSDIEEPFVDDTQLAMVCGTISLANVGKKRGWVPGSFLNDNFDYSRWRSNYGSNLLNYDSVAGTLETITSPWGEFFIRPAGDSKAFTGTTMTVEEFDKWRQDLLEIRNDLWILNAETEIVISPLKQIYSEYRCFVVDGEIITTSRYKMGSVVVYRDDITPELKAFAQRMVDLWQPARAFVIDVAETSEGFKIVEINNFNSAGFYACNVGRIVEAIEYMKF